MHSLGGPCGDIHLGHFKKNINWIELIEYGVLLLDHHLMLSVPPISNQLPVKTKWWNLPNTLTTSSNVESRQQEDAEQWAVNNNLKVNVAKYMEVVF